MDEIGASLVDSYLTSHPMHMSSAQVSSYNDFVNNKIPYTIKTLNPFVVQKNDTKGSPQYFFNIYVGGAKGDQIRLDRPTYLGSPAGEKRALTPNEARMYDMDYVSNLFVDIDIEFVHRSKTVFTKTFKDVMVGKVPIMVRSDLCALSDQPDEVRKELGECVYDQGGYFIIGGKEKVVIAQERIASNQLFVTTVKDTYEHGSIATRFPDKDAAEPYLKQQRKTNIHSHKAFISCIGKENALFPKKIEFLVYNDATHAGHRNRTMTVKLPNIGSQDQTTQGREVPLFVLFRALGVETDKDIVEHVMGIKRMTPEYRLFMEACAQDAIYIRTQQEALQYLARLTKFKTIENVHYILMDDLFPNMGDSYHEKALYLGYQVNKILQVACGEASDTDRDHYALKRVDVGGVLMAGLFKDMYNKLRNNIKDTIDQIYEHNTMFKKTGDMDILYNEIRTKLTKVAPSSIISTGMMKSMRGAWGGESDPDKQGIVQDLNRLSYVGYVSHIRRVNTPMNRDIKLVEPHRLHATQWGYVCPVESPDGGSVGLLKHLSVMCHVTNDVVDTEPLSHLLHDLSMIPLPSCHATIGKSKVFVNGSWVGCIGDPIAVADAIRAARTTGALHTDISVLFKYLQDELHIHTDAGRCSRPLLKISPSYKTGMMSLEKVPVAERWHAATEAGLIEYVDTYETENTLISMRPNEVGVALQQDIQHPPRHTHSELHPSTVLSLYTNTIPFANHNQAPRNVFSGQQGKQAIGVYATNVPNRIDTAAYVLGYPQQSLVSTMYHRHVNKENLPNGTNLIVAIATYTGYNQEDAVIINRDSIQRGLFNITYYKAFKDSESRSDDTGETVVFANPWEMEDQGGLEPRYGKWVDDKGAPLLDKDGFPRINAHIHTDDVILGKVKKTKRSKVDAGSRFMFDVRETVTDNRDVSVLGDKVTYGVVDKISVRADSETRLRTVKMRLRKTRMPELGDKMASVHGQKGTVGMILPSCDMPYTKEGIVPDLIVNPHAFPSRMTIGHIIETVFNKLCCMGGHKLDGTVFDSHDVHKIGDMLQNDYGMHRYADEVMYNGRTGEQMRTDIFFGPTYYYRLKHMVKDKVNYRSTGAVTNTTRQPTKGRANGGGLRVGEMETNAIISHGIAAFAKESMIERSDAFALAIDNHSGLIAPYNVRDGIAQGDGVRDVDVVGVPYAYNTLCQELVGMAIAPRLLMREGDDRFGGAESTHEEYLYADTDPAETATATAATAT